MGSCCGNNHSKDQNKNEKAGTLKDKAILVSEQKSTEGQKPIDREHSPSRSLKEKLQGFFGAKSN